jgi:hypothetical protein
MSEDVEDKPRRVLRRERPPGHIEKARRIPPGKVYDDDEPFLTTPLDAPVVDEGRIRATVMEQVEQEEQREVLAIINRRRLIEGAQREPKIWRSRTEGQLAPAYLRALGDNFTPEDMVEHLKEALQWAQDRKQPKNVLDIYRFIFEYTVGKPKQGVELNVGSTPQDWVRVFQDIDGTIDDESKLDSNSGDSNETDSL